MKLNIIVVTSENRGDHTADVMIPIDVVPGETVEQLIVRAGLNKPNYSRSDFVRVALIKEPQP